MDLAKKKIWLINQYAMPPALESRLRTIKFAHYLSEKGYEVTIFASSVMHNMDKDLIDGNRLFIERKYGDLNFIHIKTKNYKKNGLARLIGLIQFPFRFIRVAKHKEVPDVIIQTATVPFGNIIYYYAKKIKAKYIVEVLDLWPESFVDLGMFSKKNPLIKLAYCAEKWLYKRADHLIFSMEGGKDYIIDKKWDQGQGGPIDLNKVHYINNGVDLNDFKLFVKSYEIDDEDLKDDKIHKIIYLGSMRLANNLKHLIDAAEVLKSEANIKFLLYGDGDDREFLEEYCKARDINNVIFKQKWVNPEYVPYILSKARVNVLNYMPGNFGHYGGSQSKLFQYLAAGKPICSNIYMGYDIINKYGVGISKEYANAKEYANTIQRLANMEENKYNEICAKAKEVVKEFDYVTLTQQMINIIK